MKLNVYCGNQKASYLESTENRGVIFAYDECYLSSKNAIPLSISLPLRKENSTTILHNSSLIIAFTS